MRPWLQHCILARKGAVTYRIRINPGAVTVPLAGRAACHCIFYHH